MRNITIVLAILISSSGFAQKQKLRDKFEYKVTYKLTYQLDSTAVGEEKSEYMILFLGDDLSVYSSRAKTLTHEIVRRGNSAHTPRSALTQFHEVIVKDNAAEKLYYTLQIPKMPDRFYYPQEKNLFDWQIQEETKEIKDYKVQKATISFAGRDYIAWFAPEVPVSDGPYKFSGLPGLILEIRDKEEEWNFSFFGLEKLSPKQRFKMNLKQYKELEKQELLDLWYRYRRDPFTYANNPNVKIDEETHKAYVEGFTKMLEKENNPLELE